MIATNPVGSRKKTYCEAEEHFLVITPHLTTHDMTHDPRVPNILCIGDVVSGGSNGADVVAISRRVRGDRRGAVGGRTKAGATLTDPLLDIAVLLRKVVGSRSWLEVAVRNRPRPVGVARCTWRAGFVDCPNERRRGTHIGCSPCCRIVYLYNSWLGAKTCVDKEQQFRELEAGI